MTVLVLGLGNILLGDEGVGVRVVEALRLGWDLPAGVELVDGGTCGMDLLDVLARRPQVIIVDAVRTGQPPGTIVRLSGAEVPRFFRNRISPHQLGLSDVLAALELMGEAPGELRLFGVEPADLDTGLDLSPVVAPLVQPVAGMVADELQRLGLPVAANRTAAAAQDPALSS